MTQTNETLEDEMDAEEPAMAGKQPEASNVTPGGDAASPAPPQPVNNSSTPAAAEPKVGLHGLYSLQDRPVWYRALQQLSWMLCFNVSAYTVNCQGSAALEFLCDSLRCCFCHFMSCNMVKPFFRHTGQQGGGIGCLWQDVQAQG